MEESRGNNGDLHGNVLRLSSIRAPGSLRTSLPGSAGSRSSPSFRRVHSSRTPSRGSGCGAGSLQWIRSHQIVFWLALISMWAYIGFHVQSTWAHGDHRKPEFVGYKSEAGSVKAQNGTVKSSEPFGSGATRSVVKEPTLGEGTKGSDYSDPKLSEKVMPILVKSFPRKKGRRMLRRVKPKTTVVENTDSEFEDVVIPTRNSSFGMMVGPFGEIEDRVLGWRPPKYRGTCDRKGEFASVVWTRSFVLIFHELSMTGAPLSMMELATEIMSCGGNVKVVALTKKGGLMWELSRRGIEVLDDKGEITFKAAMKADLVIAGSAVSSSWIEQYLRHNPAGSSQLVWWIMENRQEYFNRSKHMLSKVKILTFLSDTQSKQWLSWCEEDRIKLKSQPMLVPLSVNDELAFVAGISCSLNTPAFTVEKMMEKRDLLRGEVRKKMGLSDNDMLAMTLSSINPTKGQLLLLEAAHLVAEHNVSVRDPVPVEKELLPASHKKHTSAKDKEQAGSLHLNSNLTDRQAESKHQLNGASRTSKKRKRIPSRLSNILSLSNQAKGVEPVQPKIRNLLSESAGSKEQSLKVLVGSFGSKSNKVPYVKEILSFLSQNSNMSKLVLWTRATTRVASLYAAADAYIINAQGVGETYGRVTIEAMAFGLPVLGTDAGGTREIVEDKVTGLLHPVGRKGREALAMNIKHFLNNPSERKKMGMRGRKKVLEAYLEQQTYSNMAKVIAKCLPVKQ